VPCRYEPIVLVHLGEVIMWRRAIWPLLFVASVATTTTVTGQDRKAVWQVTVAHDFSCIYTPLPDRADAVFFVGEPIDLKVVVANGTGDRYRPCRRALTILSDLIRISAAPCSRRCE
jgi:hypothetical protein